MLLLLSGEGYNVNIPWNKDMMSNVEYEAAFQRIIVPIVRQYQPDLVFIASGFDAAAADVLGEYVLTADMYGHMTHTLLQALQPDSKVLLALEGGYNCTAIGDALQSCMLVLLGDTAVAAAVGEQIVAGHEPCKRAEQTISAVMQQQAKYWKL